MASMKEAPQAIFDPSLGAHGGTRYRGAHGYFAPNPNRAKPSFCQKSPTEAHHWVIQGGTGQCKYCLAERHFPPPPPPYLRPRHEN